MENSKWAAGLYDGTQNPDVQSVANYTTNVWRMLTSVRDTNTGKLYLYLDGVSNNSVADNSGATAYTTFAVGGQVNVVNRGWNGGIDEVRVWNRALTTNEISNLYYLTK